MLPEKNSYGVQEALTGAASWQSARKCLNTQGHGNRTQSEVLTPGLTPWDTQLRATFKVGTGELQARPVFCALGGHRALAPPHSSTTRQNRKEPVTQVERPGEPAGNLSAAETGVKLQSRAAVPQPPTQASRDPGPRWGVNQLTCRLGDTVRTGFSSQHVSPHSPSIRLSDH